MIVDELVSIVKFDIDTKPLNQINKSINTIKSSMGSLGGFVSNSLRLTMGLFDNVTKNASANYEWAKSVGVSTDSMQRFQNAISSVGGNLDAIKGDLERWARTAQTTGKSIEDIFLEESAAIEGYDASISRGLLQKRQYSEETIRLLQKGSQNLQDLFSNASITPEDQLKEAYEYSLQYREAIIQLRKTFEQAVTAALPKIIELINRFNEFFRENREEILAKMVYYFETFVETVRILANILSEIVSILHEVWEGAKNIGEQFGINLEPIDAARIAIGLLALEFTAKLIPAVLKIGTSLSGISTLIKGLTSLSWGLVGAFTAAAAGAVGVAKGLDAITGTEEYRREQEERAQKVAALGENPEDYVETKMERLNRQIIGGATPGITENYAKQYNGMTYYGMLLTNKRGEKKFIPYDESKQNYRSWVPEWDEEKRNNQEKEWNQIGVMAVLDNIIQQKRAAWLDQNILQLHLPEGFRNVQGPTYNQINNINMGTASSPEALVRALSENGPNIFQQSAYGVPGLR